MATVAIYSYTKKNPSAVAIYGYVYPYMATVAIYEWRNQSHKSAWLLEKKEL